MRSQLWLLISITAQLNYVKCDTKSLTVTLRDLKYSFSPDEIGASDVTPLDFQHEWNFDSTNQGSTKTRNLDFSKTVEFNVDVKFDQDFDFAKRIVFIASPKESAKFFRIRIDKGAKEVDSNQLIYKSKRDEEFRYENTIDVEPAQNLTIKLDYQIKMITKIIPFKAEAMIGSPSMTSYQINKHLETIAFKGTHLRNEARNVFYVVEGEIKTLFGIEGSNGITKHSSALVSTSWSTTSNERKVLPWWAILLIVIGVVGLVIGVGFIVYAKKSMFIG